MWRWLSEGSAGSPRSGLSVAGSSWRAPFGDRSPCNAQQGVILDDQISRVGEVLAGQGGGGAVVVSCRVWRQTCREGEVGVAELSIGAAVRELQQCEGWLVANRWQT